MTEQMKKDCARAYLLQKKDQNINLIAALEGGLAEVVQAEERGCLLCTAGEVWQIAAADAETALRFFERVPAETTMLEVQEVSQIDAVAARFKPRTTVTYYNAWYAESSVALPDIGAEVRLLGAADAETIAPHYHLPGPSAGDIPATAGYLRGRAASGTLYGAYFDGALAGFVGTHNEGSLGILTVLPEFRRHAGLGTFLELLAIEKAVERGHIPFGQIEVENEASLALQRSLGLTIAKDPVCWMDK